MPALTLHHGGQERVYVEHPTETAREALLAAAAVEAPRLADQLRRFADALPRRRARPASEQGDSGEEFLPVVLRRGWEGERRERIDICSTYEEALAEAEERVARWRRADPTARAAVLRRRVGEWEET